MKPKTLILLFFSIQSAYCELRRSETSWSESNKDFTQNFTDSIFYIGNQYVSYKEYNLTKLNGELVKTYYKCEKYKVHNESVPVRFAGHHYYWNDASIRNETHHICEYLIGDNDGKLRQTYLNTTKLEVLYFKCNLLDTCDGLRCVPMETYKKVVCIGGLSALVIFLLVTGVVCCKRHRTKKESVKREQKTRNNSFDTIVT